MFYVPRFKAINQTLCVKSGVNMKLIMGLFLFFCLQGCLKAGLEFLGLPFEGRAHNGLDDSKNICKVLMHFLQAGCIIYQTEKILLQPCEQERNEKRILNDKAAGKYDLATVACMSSKKFEHIVVYATDSWSVHRCVPPEMYLSELMPEGYDSATEIMSMTCGSGESCGYYSHYQPSTSGSCESIASGCSNKENSIPLYIPPSNTSKSVGSMKSRASATVSLKEVVVSANGPGGDSSGSDSSSNLPTFVSSGRSGRRKKRNAQLKDHHGSSISTGTTSFNKPTEEDGVVTVSAAGLVDVDVPQSSPSVYLQSKTTLESTGTQTTHLQQLVSDLRTEE